MNYLNEKSRQLKQGAIRAMFDKAANMTNVISMGIGEPDFDTDPDICEIGKKALDSGKTHYTPNAGIPELRKVIAEKSYLKDLNYKWDKEIIITNGGMGALSLLMAVILSPGDEIIIQDPQWLNYIEQVKYYDGVPIRVPTFAKDNFEIQEEELEKAITSKTKAIMLNSPNNPTGYVMSKSALENVAKIAQKYDLLVITDEVYNTLIYDGENVSIATLPNMKDRTVVVNSFSKSFAMTGWRVGYAAGPEYIIDKMVKLQENFNACVNSMGQYAAAYAVTRPDISESMKDVFLRRRNLLIDELKKIEGFEFNVPTGGFYIFPSIKKFGLDDVTFCEKLLEDQHVVCIPGSAFGECGSGHIRIAYTDKEENLLTAAKRIKAFCDSL